MGSEESKPIQQVIVQNELNLSSHEVMKECFITFSIVISVEIIKYFLAKQKKKYAKKVLESITSRSA
jgi:hypothetical protein